MISSLPDPCVIGHEGGGEPEPGNTLAAINHGLEQGADAIEVDVRMTGDRHLIVYHGKLDRIVDVHGTPIADIPLSEWKRRYPESFLPEEYHDEEVIELSELLDRKEDTAFLLDVKNYHLPPDRTSDLIDELNAVLGERNQANRICVASFDHELLQKLSRDRKEMRTGLIAGSNDLHLPQELDVLEPDVLLPNVRFAGKRMRELTTNRSTDLIPWVVNRAPIAEIVLNAGVDGVITDAPGRLISSVQRLKSRQ